MERISFLTRTDPTEVPPRGFTLVEMLVVLAIISILTSLALLGQSTFNKSLLLTDTAYGIAFSGREAQTFGVSSRKFGSVQDAGYGLHFDRSTPGSYVVFADISNPSPIPSNCPVGVSGTPEQKPGNCRFDSGSPADGIVNTYTFDRGFFVQSFCGKSGATRYCSTDTIPLTTLDTVFTRPNTSATITGLRSGSVSQFSCAEITLADGTGAAKQTIRISGLGEISVGQTCP